MKNVKVCLLAISVCRNETRCPSIALSTECVHINVNQLLKQQSRFLSEKFLIRQTVKKLPALCRIQNFNAVSTRVDRWLCPQGNDEYRPQLHITFLYDSF